MARPTRIERPGAWYHLTARGNEQRAIYRDDRDRTHFCELLAEAVARFRLALPCFVLMENHFHLLLETLEPNLSAAMQWLNVSYSVWFNRRHQRVGHLFQGRFKAVVVDPAGWGLELSRYVHLNPVRVGRYALDKAARQQSRAGAGNAPERSLVQQRLAFLRQYPWSSYRACVGLANAPAWLQPQRILNLGGNRKCKDQQSTYREYVESAVRQGLPARPWEQLTAQMVLGTAAFLEGLRDSFRGDPREQTALRQLPARPTLAEVIAQVEMIKGEQWPGFRDRYGDWGRDLVLYVGRKDGGLKLRTLAEAAGGIDYVSAGAAVQRFTRRLASDAQLAARVRQVREGLMKCRM